MKKNRLLPFLTPSVKNREMVIYNRVDSFWGWMAKKQGLFAEFFAVLGALEYAEKNEAAAVSVFFNTDIYLDKEHGNNWWAYFFEPVMILNPEIKKPGKRKFNKIYRYFGPHGWQYSWIKALRIKHTSREPYPMNNGEECKHVGRLTKDYIRVKPHLIEKTEQFWHSHNSENLFTIGIHYRGTDKKVLYPYVSPSYTVFNDYINRVLEKYRPSGYRIFVASDELEFIDWIMEKHGDHIFFWEDAPRLSSQDPEASKGGTHKSSLFSNYKKGETAVIDCLLLSRCSYLIKNRSSLSDASMAFNPKLEWTMVLGDSEVCSSRPDI